MKVICESMAQGTEWVSCPMVAKTIDRLRMVINVPSAPMRAIYCISSLFCAIALLGCPDSNTPQNSGGGDITLPDNGGTTSAPDVPKPPADVPEPHDEATPDPDPGLPPTDEGEETAQEDPGTTPLDATLVINELMYNPKSVDDEFGEWVELYNAGDTAVDLKGWVLRDKGSNNHTIETAVVVEPGAYVVLGRSGEPETNGGFTAHYVYSDFFLSNTADSVVIADPTGHVVDELSYATEGDWPESQAGVSIELIDVGKDNAVGGSWTHAIVPYGHGDLGTPGGPNGQPEAEFEIDDTVGGWQNPELKASLRFAPFDELEDFVLGKLAKADSHIRMAYFNVRLPAVKWMLQALKDEGVDVRVALDAKQQLLEYNTMAEELMELDIPVELILNEKAEQSTMHHKFIVIDQKTVLMGSANLSSTALNKSDEDLLAVESPELAARYLAEWEELGKEFKDKTEPYEGNPPIQAWMGPEDDLDGKVLSMLDNAKSTVLVAIFQINHTQLINKLIEVHDAGKTVIVVIDGEYKADGGAETTLADAGIPVIEAENTLGQFAEMHSKLLIVDYKRIAMGSYNWTNLASFFNDESLAIIEDEPLAWRAGGKFAELLKAYSEKTADELGLETGDHKVTLTMTNLQLNAGATLVIQSIAGDGPWSQPTALTDYSISATLPAGTRLEYRYGVQGEGAVYWESGSKHFFTLPYAKGPFAVKDTFRNVAAD